MKKTCLLSLAFLLFLTQICLGAVVTVEAEVVPATTVNRALFVTNAGLGAFLFTFNKLRGLYASIHSPWDKVMEGLIVTVVSISILTLIFTTLGGVYF